MYIHVPLLPTRQLSSVNRACISADMGLAGLPASAMLTFAEGKCCCGARCHYFADEMMLRRIQALPRTAEFTASYVTCNSCEHVRNRELGGVRYLVLPVPNGARLYGV